tara:strand:- start:1115 stop:1369 length:255 start_codon:yes stop_codon:yes gene_type:complete
MVDRAAVPFENGFGSATRALVKRSVVDAGFGLETVHRDHALFAARMATRIHSRADVQILAHRALKVDVFNQHVGIVFKLFFHIY